MGVFAALIFPTTLSIISNTFRERRQRAAAAGAPLLGQRFLALAPLALAASVLGFVLVPEHPMLDVKLFTGRRFSAASGAVAVTFFALAGFIVACSVGKCPRARTARR